MKSDLLRAELLAFPIALLCLIRFVGGWRAAAAILMTTVTALAASILLIAAASRAIEISIFALSTVAMLTIALSLDFGLLRALRPRHRTAARNTRTIVLTAS